MRLASWAPRIETVLLVALVALSIGLTVRIWMSFPNPFLVKEPRTLVTTKKANLPQVMPLRSGGRVPRGGLFLSLPGDPVASAAFSELMKASSRAPGLGRILQGVSAGSVRRATEDPFWLFLLPAGLDPFLGSAQSGPSRLIADPAAHRLFIVTPSGSFAEPLAPSVSHALLALLAEKLPGAADMSGIGLGPGLSSQEARLVRLQGIPASLDGAGSPGLLLPTEHLLLAGAHVKVPADPSRALVHSFFDNPLLVREIDEAGGIRSFTDGQAELRTLPQGRFVYSLPGSRSGLADAGTALQTALGFLAAHPGLVGPSLTWSDVTGKTGATVTFVPLVGQVPLEDEPDRVTITGSAVTGATGRVASVVMDRSSYALRAEGGLMAAFAASPHVSVFAVFPAYQSVGSNLVAGQQVLFADGTSLWLPAKGG